MARKHGTRAHPMLKRARRGAPTSAEKKAELHYKRNRASILRKKKAYYRKHKSRILREAKMYRRKTRGKPYYKSGHVGGRYPRFKRMKRLNKYPKRHGR